MSEPASAWQLSAWTAAKWAAAVALLMSTQYLAQPFVWRNWPVDEVVAGWIGVARDRALVAATIAGALVCATHLAARRVIARAALIGAAVTVGAMCGELLLLALDLRDERVDPWSIAGRVVQWSVLGLCIAGMYVLWMRDRVARASTQAMELSRSAAEASAVLTQLQSLRRQIDPHFLFNTLATIRSFGQTQAIAGARLLRHLVAYLRSTMPSGQPRTSLGDELDLVASYLAIVAVRMSGRLQVSIDVPEALRRHACPPLTLATLVENAVKHGIMPSASGGAISVTARRADDMLEMVVADTGVGFSPSVGGSGIGLSNVRARVRALHGARASLTIEANVPRGVRATILLPFAARPAP